MTGGTRRTRAPDGPRSKQITVFYSDGELSTVERAADQAGMAAAAWLGESGLREAKAESGQSVGLSGAAALALLALRSELMETRRVLRNIGGNLNDVARHANATGELRPDTGQVQELVARVVARVEDTVRHVDEQTHTVVGQAVRGGHTRTTQPGRVATDGHTGQPSRGHDRRRGHSGQIGHEVRPQSGTPRS